MSVRRVFFSLSVRKKANACMMEWEEGDVWEKNMRNPFDVRFADGEG